MNGTLDMYYEMYYNNQIMKQIFPKLIKLSRNSNFQFDS